MLEKCSDMINAGLFEYLRRRLDRFFSYRPRSEFETRRYLQRKLVQKNILDSVEQEQIIKTLLAEMSHMELINDEQFARWWIDERTYFKPRGARRLKHELLEKGIHKDLIDKQLSKSNLDEVKLIREIIIRRHIKEFNDKLIKYFLRRGFSYENIKKAIEELDKNR